MYNKGQTMTQTKSSESVASISQLQFARMPERGISQETCKFFNVRMSIDTQSGEPTSYYFPYYNQKGELTGWKRRDLTLEKYDKYHFTTVGKVGTDCKLFGQQQVENSNAKRCYLAEGECDVMAAWQALKNGVKGTKFEDMVPVVVGLSCGTGNATEAVANNAKWLSKAQTLYLAFDNDEATEREKQKGIKKGKDATEDVASVLMADNVRVIEWDEDHIDPSSYTENGEEQKLKQLLLSGGREFVAEKIVKAHKYDMDAITAPRPEGIHIPAFPELMKLIHGFRTHELAVLTALSGAGKTSVTTEMAFSLAYYGDTVVGMVYLEEEDRDTIQRLMARYLEVNYNLFKFNPKKYATDEQLQEAFEWVDNHFIFLDHFGSLRIEELMNKIKTMVYINHCKYIFLDHLTLTISGQKINDDTKQLDIAMTELAAFVSQTDVGIIAVSHLNRAAASEIQGLSKQTEPQWIKMKKEDMRSSSSLEALSWIVLGIDLELMPDSTRGRIRPTVLKNRPWGLLGEGDVVKMNDKTGLFENASDARLNDYT